MSWLNDYLAYTQKQESPEQFHMWAGITAIAAALGRNVWMDRRSGGVTRYRVYPGQIMTVLVAGSGRARKSIGLEQVKPFLRKIGKPFIGGKSSPEAFLRQMDPNNAANPGHPQAILFEGELTVLLTKGNYSEPLIEILTKLADAPDDFAYDTISHGRIIIPKPCLTMLGATTVESFGEGMPTRAQGSGFLARLILVYAKGTDRIEDLSDIDDEDISPSELAHMRLLKNSLDVGMARFQMLGGPFTFTKKGREWFRAFYRRWVDSPMGQGEGWPAKRVDHMLRVGMVIAAAKGTVLELDEYTLQAADRLLFLVEQDFDKAMAFVGTNYARDRQRIVDFIATKGGKATTLDIVSALYPYFMDPEILKRTIRLLGEVGVLKRTISPTPPQIESWELAGFTILP